MVRMAYTLARMTDVLLCVGSSTNRYGRLKSQVSVSLTELQYTRSCSGPSGCAFDSRHSSGWLSMSSDGASVPGGKKSREGGNVPRRRHHS